MGSRSEREIDCQGRFDGLRDSIEEAVSIVDMDRGTAIIDREYLNDVFGLIGIDGLLGSDSRDPYFKEGHTLRAPTNLVDPSPYSIVPLLPRNHELDPALVREYARLQGAEGSIEDLLAQWHTGVELTSELKIPESTRIAIAKVNQQNKPPILTNDRAEIKGYSLRTKFGIGPFNDAEGKNIDPVVPDTAYSIELYDKQGDIALQIGFWYRNDETHGHTMVVGQIQNPQNSQLPGGENAQMGIVGLEVARVVAEHMGIQAMETYAAGNHPMFRQYPERKGRMMGGFKCYFDSSAKALGYEAIPFKREEGQSNGGKGQKNIGYRLMLTS